MKKAVSLSGWISRIGKGMRCKMTRMVHKVHLHMPRFLNVVGEAEHRRFPAPGVAVL